MLLNDPDEEKNIVQLNVEEKPWSNIVICIFKANAGTTNANYSGVKTILVDLNEL